MRKVLAVIRREFVERVRQRWFWVMALLGPVLFGAIFYLPTLLSRGGGVKHIVVVDATTSDFGVQITNRLNQPDRQGKAVFVATRLPSTPGLEDSLAIQVGAKRLDGFLIVTNETVDSGRAEYRADNVSSFVANSALERSVSELVNAARLEREGVDPNLVARARIQITLKTEKLSGGKTTGESAEQSFTLAYFMAFILYFAILVYGINVMSSVLEEKTSRVVEVLVSSLRPFQLLLGKVLGVGAVSLFQFVIWGVSGRFLVAQRSRLIGEAAAGDAGQVWQIPHISGQTALVFIAYFIGGFLLYSAMFAAVGAMSSNEQEARQTQQPVMYVLMISYFSMFAMINDPGSTLSVTLSLIPFSAPIAMPVRWAAGNLPVSEVALSLGILFVSIVGVTWVASRIYRVGILMTGKRPSVKELVRWVRTA
jgi:ABC-2 type transport system permease protein